MMTKEEQRVNGETARRTDPDAPHFMPKAHPLRLGFSSEEGAPSPMEFNSFYFNDLHYGRPELDRTVCLIFDPLDRVSGRFAGGLMTTSLRSFPDILNRHGTGKLL